MMTVDDVLSGVDDSYFVQWGGLAIRRIAPDHYEIRDGNLEGAIITSGNRTAIHAFMTEHQRLGREEEERAHQKREREHQALMARRGAAKQFWAQRGFALKTRFAPKVARLP